VSVLQFDHHSADFADHWRDQYAAARETCPVLHTDAHGGFTVLTRYDDVKRALLSPDEFACGRELALSGVAGVVPGGVTIPTNPFRMGMMEMDPPESSALRRLLVGWFSARAVDQASGHLRELITWCIDRVVETGQLDVVDDLANPIPALITLDLLGLPLSNWRRYGPAKQIAWLLDDLRSVLERRRDAPAAVLTPVDALLAAEVDGARFPVELAVELVFMLLNGGIDTSTALIAHSLRHLSAHPDQRAQLAADPTLIPAAVDEFLRYFTPGTGIARTARHDTNVGGVEIRAGERVYLALGAANSDPAVFDAADTVDLGRSGNRHLAFGAGIHRCLGSFLAVREMTILLEEVLLRLPDLRIDEAGVRAYRSVPLVAGFEAMPATFTPGTRIGRFDSDEIPPARGERELAAAATVAGTHDDRNEQ
jgi:cytochrome P450